MHLIALDFSLLDRAGEIAPDDLRSLDAIHVVSALALGADLGEFFTYDQRLADAARYQGLSVVSPS
jgi:predicted nucleic acid-binding protein